MNTAPCTFILPERLCCSLSLVLFAGFIVIPLLFTGCSVIPRRKVQEAVTDNEQLSLEEKWGIEIVGIRQSAAGYMLDFRYRVIDPDKAMRLTDRRIKPYLIDNSTGARLMVPSPPKVGPLRQTSVKPFANKTYFILFANPGKMVKAGSKVSVVIGDFKADNLVVE